MMKCNCKVAEIILGIIILLSLWLLPIQYYSWIITIAAVIIVLHALSKHHMHMHSGEGMAMKQSAPGRRRR